MSQEKTPVRRKLESVEKQEEMIWVEFYPQARSDVDLAAELIAELDRDDTLRRRHRGLYLRCQRCLRLHESREARNRRIGRFVRGLLSTLFVVFPKAVLQAWQRGRNVAIACLPETDDDRAEQQVKRLLESDAYAVADKTFRTRARRAAEKSDATPADPSAADAPSVPRAAAG